jgi:hypothetical protein
VGALGIFIGFIEEVLKKAEAAAVELSEEKDRRPPAQNGSPGPSASAQVIGP